MRVLDRMREIYNQKRRGYTGCFFCDEVVLAEQNCTRFVYTYWYVLVNKYPYQNGNVILVPKAHKTKLAELTPAEWVEFGPLLVEVQEVLGTELDTDSFNIALNEGEASGRSVPHLHWQVIPRWFKNHTAVGIFSDIHVVTLAPSDLKQMLSK